MITEQALRQALLDQTAHPLDNGRAIRTAIHQITDEYQMPAVGMLTIMVVAEALYQLLQYIELTMHITDDV